MNIQQFSIILYCIFQINQCHANQISCKYKISEFMHHIRISNQQYTAYTCHVGYESQKFDEITEFLGKHEDGMTDDDVKKIEIPLSKKIIKFTSIFCQKFRNVEIIHVYDNDIESFAEESFQNCQNLGYFFFASNKLRDVPENLFSNNSKLVELSLSRIQLSSLPENLFKNQQNLEQLLLQQNKLSFLPSNFFNSLVNLQRLWLSNNKLQALDPEWFINFKNLQKLFLEKNQFLEVPSGVFKNLNHLEILYLNQNKIKTLHPDSFEGLQKLHMLILDSNAITELAVDLFTPLKSLHWLMLSENKISVVHSDSFGIHKNLTNINLKDNKITAFDEKILDNAGIEMLNMENNLCCKRSISYMYLMKEKLNICFKNYKPRCGMSKTSFNNIPNGSQVTRGSFPWVAAVERINGKLLCTGTLVDRTKVVTAANCIQGINVDTPIQASDLRVVVGAHNMRDQNEDGRTTIKVKIIHVHPRWNPKSEKYDSDIAVLVLDQEATGRFIAPACLIDIESTIDSINHGLVVGLQNSEYIATAIDITIRKNRACEQIYPNISKVSSIRTFCGATTNGTCNIGSGSSLYVQRDGAFYLRGLATTFVQSQNDQCSADSVTIFTNMLLYTGWINGI